MSQERVEYFAGNVPPLEKECEGNARLKPLLLICSVINVPPDSFSRITDVQDFVSRSQRSCPPFVLTTSLPFRELNDKDLSLEEADLANAVIVQRPLNTQAPFGHS